MVHNGITSTLFICIMSCTAVHRLIYTHTAHNYLHMYIHSVGLESESGKEVRALVH